LKHALAESQRAVASDYSVRYRSPLTAGLSARFRDASSNLLYL